MDGKIHFLNTGYSDCIVLESCGKIAMVDAGEDTDYPQDKPNLKNLPGYEDVVVDYLLKNFAVPNGRVTLEFVLGTHCHSDHIGGFDTVIDYPQIDTKTAYLKPYREQDIFFYERRRWDNTEVYTQMLEAIQKNGVQLVDDFDNLKIKLGDFDITFFNGSYKKHRRKYGENINSVVTLVELGTKKALLAGDMNNKDGDESRLSKILPAVDILKVGHHGYPYSSTSKFLRALSPKYAVVCNYDKKIYPNIRWRLNHIAKAKIITTADNNGVIADMSDNFVNITTNIM